MPSFPEYPITATDFLFRRFPILNEPRFIPFFKVENGQKVPTSAAFKTKPGENGLSVDIAALTSPEFAVQDVKRFGLAELSAEIPLSAGFPCAHDPQPDNHSHALILGDTAPIAKKLARNIRRAIVFD